MNTRVRRSQFIRTFGPGSILSAGKKSGVVANLSRAVIRGGDWETWRIDDMILSELVRYSITRLSGESCPGNIRIIEIPGYDSQGEPQFVLDCIYFPRWHLCPGNHDGKGAVLFSYSSRGCPVCGNSETSPVRFIVVCPFGHMDDIPWNEAVHGKSAACYSRYFYWQVHGKNVDVICPVCRRKTTLGEIRKKFKNRELLCSCFMPEEGKREQCPSHYPGAGDELTPQILLKNASSVRISETLTVFAVWPRITEEHRFFLCHDDLRVNAFRLLEEDCSKNRQKLKEFVETEYEKFREKLLRYIRRQLVPEYAELFEKEDGSPLTEKLVEVIWDIYEACRLSESETGETEKPRGVDFSMILLREFENLMRGMNEGVPPQALKGARMYLEMSPREGSALGNLFFQTVRKLTGYQILLGYRRVDPVRGRFIPVYRSDGDIRWFVASVLGGEGIFLTFMEPEAEFFLDRNGEATQSWYDLYRSVRAGRYSNIYRDFLFRCGVADPVELHPAFVFLHTLSHLFIRALGVFAGYSSAAIRERVYVFPDVTDPFRARGGILFYTGSEDEDGSLGGLISLCRNEKAVEKLMEYVMDQVEECSCDPVCAEQKIEPGKYCGAACHACVTVSETSCEHRNMWLDRRVVLENLHLFRK